MKRDEDIKRQFGAILKKIREAKEMTQTQLGNEVGMEGSHISRIERGTTDLKLTTIVKFAEALGVSPAELMKF